MGLQGNLRDFSATEILQLLGMQQKTGCLLLERDAERVSLFVLDGRIVSARQPGMAADDPLLAFLHKVHRLSSEQHLGIAALQKESGRDLEDILVNGRYVDSDELAGYLERQIFDVLARVVRWDSGNYRFEPAQRWDRPVHVRLTVEGAIIEAARRVDEAQRSAQRFKDPAALLAVRDLPDPDAPLADEERELFAMIDGRHTLAEVVAAAPLTESEAYEALDRMLDANWIEFAGRRDPGARPAPPPPAAAGPPRAPAVRHALTIELLLVLGMFAIATAAGFGAHRLHERCAVQADDVFVSAQMRDVRYALELFRRERGTYPPRLDELATDRWVSPSQLDVPGFRLSYRVAADARGYELRLEPLR